MCRIVEYAQLIHHQRDVAIVKVDARFHRLLYRLPVSLFKALLRASGNIKKATILRVKALQNSMSN